MSKGREKFSRSILPPRGVHTDAVPQIICPYINIQSCVSVFGRLLCGCTTAMCTTTCLGVSLAFAFVLLVCKLATFQVTVDIHVSVRDSCKWFQDEFCTAVFMSMESDMKLFHKSTEGAFSLCCHLCNKIKSYFCYISGGNHTTV